MASDNPAMATVPPSATARPRYATGLGRITRSAPYRLTVGAAIGTRFGRLALLAGVPIIWLIALHIGPIFEMFKISLYATYPVESHTGLTFAGYRSFFADPLYYQPLIRSFVFSFIVTGTALIVVYPVAYYVARIVKPEGRFRALLLLLVPFWAGEIIRLFSVIMLLANRGAVNALLMNMGLTDRPIPMLYTGFSLGFGMIYLICLFMLLPLYSAIDKIPVNLLDAAADLGAGPFTRFRRIILPLTRDGIVSGCSLVFLTSIGVFAAPILLGGPDTTLFPSTIAVFFHGASDGWPAGAAFSMILLVTSLITVGIFMRLVGGRPVKV